MKHRLQNKVCVIALIGCMLLSLFPISVMANPDMTGLIQEAPADAIILSSPEDVVALADNCRVNTWSVGKTVVLVNDIDMSKVDFQGIPTFAGTFLGQGHKIKGICFEHDGSVVGLFRYLQKTAVVNGLTIEGVIAPSGSKSIVGAIAGNNAGVIRNCTVNIQVDGYEQIGGIVGVNEVSGLIENCLVTGSVSGSHFVGGVVGENHGVVRNCTNQSKVNTTSVQNSVEVEDITLDSLINTESAYTTTDIGGIAGISSGVIRACVNESQIGYQKMSYNVGGIVGTQNGFVVDCVNKADVLGRKEVGGIVGHMEPNIVINYSEDSLQKLDGQVGQLNSSVNDLQNTVDATQSDLTNQITGLEDDLRDVQSALDVLGESVRPNEDGYDEDRITAARNDLSDSLNKVYNKSDAIYKNAEESSNNISNQMDGMVNQVEEIRDTANHFDEGIKVELEDVSGQDTEEDTIGKISNCINLGTIKGDINIGGIAGVMAEETDLDEDFETVGEESLNVTGKIRVVIRDCRNAGTVIASKQYAGGIVGQMITGAVLETINVGNLDCLNVDYVGGIAGMSNALIRDCSSKAILAGDVYVGGIAGYGKRAINCISFVRADAFIEKTGAIFGDASELPDGVDDIVQNNKYFVAGKQIGGIDGIDYTGATDALDLASFLQLENLDEVFKTVTVKFIIEGQDDVIENFPVGESLALENLPEVNVDSKYEYDWEYIPAVNAERLAMGETASTEYISSDLLTDILFNQTYKAVVDAKNTVISSELRNDKNLAVILAEGTFAKYTTLEITDLLASGSVKDINGIVISECWEVNISNSGVTKLHYLLPENADIEKMVLYVLNTSGEWTEKTFIIEGSYMIFDFADGDVGFAFAHKEGRNMTAIFVVVAVIMLLSIMVGAMTRKRLIGRKKA